MLICPHWEGLVTPRFVTGLNSSLLPGRVRVLQNYQLNLESLSTEQELSACCRPHVFRMSREGIRLLRRSRAGGRVLNKLFIFSPDTFNHHTHLSDQISASGSLTQSGYSQMLNVKVISDFCFCWYKWALPLVPMPRAHHTHLIPNQTLPVSSSQSSQQHYKRKIFLSVLQLIDSGDKTGYCIIQS